MLRTLAQPNNPKEAIESRRNPCYGFAVVVDIQEHTKLLSILTEARNEILKIVDPDRAQKKHPIHSPLYIKQSFFHASVFGMTPLLEKEQYVNIYANENGLLDREVMDTMCDTLHTHLKQQKPSLEPDKCELINKDGTILARFTYKTEAKDDAPLFTLANQLDPEAKFSKWQANNKLRNTTVTVAICVIDKDKMSEKLETLQHLLDHTTAELKKLDPIDITHFHLISSYDKRTLSLKHISMYANVGRDNVCKI
jgi:hypothetical protein